MGCVFGGRWLCGRPGLYKMPSPEMDGDASGSLGDPSPGAKPEQECLERQLAELRVRQGRMELGLCATLLLLAAIVVWALFFREPPARGGPGKTLPSVPRQGRLPPVCGIKW